MFSIGEAHLRKLAAAVRRARDVICRDEIIRDHTSRATTVPDEFNLLCKYRGREIENIIQFAEASFFLSRLKGRD